MRGGLSMLFSSCLVKSTLSLLSWWSRCWEEREIEGNT
ncbi:hypothetical protein PORCRE_102 [Porphyromonas crevioricanis JCM 15906]|uniref:Uncharacterized protein n=1 Tax=Porphyromonas crevioricanis JCM 15906 TaxID=1305617 RepID=S4N6L3_9PORP|nr:hypothetical protein PORCRE_102 [Porphyromonas crevioricanis JCM 15906]GAD07286.1 hypothetical protein PORCAN_906 [Porphyromonas crevioricanis JCM 13913]